MGATLTALASDNAPPDDAAVSNDDEAKKQKEEETSLHSEDIKCYVDANPTNSILVPASDTDSNIINGNGVNLDSLNDECDDDDEHKSIDDVVVPKLLEAGQLPQREIEHFSMNEDEIQEKSIPLSWSNCDATTFSTRIGPNYVSGQKAPSDKALYTMFAVDAYTTPQKMHKIWEHVDIEKHIKKHATPYDADKFPLPPLFIMNLMMPNYPPEMMSGKADGEGLSSIIYAHISPETRAKLEAYSKDPVNDPMSPAIDLLQRFIHSDLVHSELRNRFKCIVRLMNPNHTDFGFLANRLVNKYNAKPFLVRTSSTFYHEPGKYFAADIDIHVFGYPARRGLNYVKSTLQTAIYDMAMTIEGKSDDELPEQILACARICNMGFDVCKPFPEQNLKQNVMSNHDKNVQRKSESMRDLPETGKLENENKMPSHSQSAKNMSSFAKDPTMNGTDAEREAEIKKKGCCSCI